MADIFISYSRKDRSFFATRAGSDNAPELRKLVADIGVIAGPPPAFASEAATPSAPQKAPEAPEAPPDEKPKQNPSGSSKVALAPRLETQTSPEPGPRSAVPTPPFTFGRRGVIAAMISFAVAALAGGTCSVGATEKPDPDGEPRRPDVGQDQYPPFPWSVFRDTLKDGSQGPEMVVIPRGELKMGCISGKGCQSDELPVHAVTFDKPFAIGKYEVTFADYDRFAEATGAEKPYSEGWGRGRRPVINVTWNEATAYAEWLSRQTGKRYRLPSETEGEYATRGGTTMPFSTGDCIDTDQANHDGNYGWGDCPTTGVYRRKTLEIGSLPANSWGLHEVHGNVWEWMQDCWHNGYQGAPTTGGAWNKVGFGDCDLHVVRGGSWFDSPVNLRSAARGRNLSDFRDFTLGFRLARDP